MSKNVKILIAVVVAIVVAVIAYFLLKKNKQASAIASPGILPRPEIRNENTVADLSNGSDLDVRYTPPPSASILPIITPAPTGPVTAPVANTTISSAATAYSAPVPTETVSIAPTTSTADAIPADGTNVLDPRKTTATI